MPALFATMSPKSAFISLATVSTLAATCGNCLRAIIQNSKNTSVTSEILALSNEVSDLQAVLGEVEAHRQACSDSTGSAAQAEEPDALTPHLLKRAHSRLLQLENLSWALSSLVVIMKLSSKGPLGCGKGDHMQQ